MHQDQNQHLLAELELNLVQAGPWKRFANYLIDAIAYYVFIIVFFFFYGMVYAILNPDNIADIRSSGSLFTIYLLSFVLYVVMYCLMEGLSKGRTLGKLITGTKVVYQDGAPISMYTALMRSLSRLVPFEFLSAFGSPSFPWHDKWTDTYVIDVKYSSIPS